jgi:hypothetical protein
MNDVDQDIHRGLDRLTSDVPTAPEWAAIEQRGRVRRRRRTAIVGVACVVAVVVVIAAIGRVGDDQTTVVAGPTDTTAFPGVVPCGSWIAVHTLFDSSANQAGGDVVTVPRVTAEQAAFLVKSGDVPDRVAREIGGDPTELASRITVTPNPNLGTIQIVAWAEEQRDARRLADAFAGSLLDSVQDIQQRELDRQRDVLNSVITQLELELAGTTGDDRSSAASRDRLTADISAKKVQLQELDQQAAQGSNIYSFGSSEAFRVTGDDTLAVLNPGTDTTTDLDGGFVIPSPPATPALTFDTDC